MREIEAESWTQLHELLYEGSWNEELGLFRSNLAYRGRVTLSPLAVDLGVAGEVDLAILDRHVVRTDLGLEGHGQFRGTVRLDQGRLRVAGRMAVR